MKKQIIIHTDGHQSIYDFTHTKDKYKTTEKFNLFRSYLDGWTNPGEKVLAYHNTGNGVDLKLGDKTYSIDYEELALLKMLFHVITTENIPTKYIVMKCDEVIEAMEGI